MQTGKKSEHGWSNSSVAGTSSSISEMDNSET
jgi:hypothetical protein